MIPPLTPDLDEALYRKLRHICARFATKQLALDDLTQAVALRMVRHRLIARFNAARGPLDGYLYVIVRSIAWTERRRAYREAGYLYRHARETRRLRALAIRDTIEAHVQPSRQGSGLQAVAATLSPAPARLLTLLCAGVSRTAARPAVGGRQREERAYRELQEAVRATVHPR